MNSIDLLKKKILYRSEYRGIKETELLLNNFIKKYINDFGIAELKQLNDLLNFDDDSLFKWYLNKKVEVKIPNNKVSKLLKNFKI
ncbi:MAG: succinate dehydrogenase assembly factor 2 [Candidatus Pelagibacter sp.]|jgi:antitoxin CptB|nr:succinate dehydrogenase assembly factor 2 [Candidatus Pelagibacter sp.]|tara:strand:- start:93 stop:347 length:255 start_codon:yes stop_codon:yes gene_type:complete